MSAQRSAPPRVLSIQSHVVHGCVGNRAATLPLQLLGVETDVLNTVQYSNHVGYGSFAGEKLSGEQVWALLQGMHTNGLLAPDRLLTGYMGSAEAVRAVVKALPLLREARPDFQYWCDPVLGDNGRLYVPPALVDTYREEVVPYAHALLPNQFEAELLSGVTIRTVEDAQRACAALHRRNVNLVMITSAEMVATPPDVSSEAAPASPAVPSVASAAASSPASTKPPLTVLLSQRPHASLWRRVYVVQVPQLPEHFAGTGDLLAALLLGWNLRPGVAPHEALHNALAGVRAVLHKTVAAAPPPTVGVGEGYGSGTRPLGLRLLDSIDEIRKPDVSAIEAPTRLDQPLRAVLFDMDGTLTLPEQLDFERMRVAAGLPDGAPIFEAIGALPTEAARASAWAAIEAIELEAYSSIQLQPGLAELLGGLRARGVRIGIATRNTAKAVPLLLKAAGLAEDTFHPVLSRDSGFPDKPHPAIAHAACDVWGLPAAACLFVGDSKDDVRCGRAAGMLTCFLQPPDAPEDALPPEADFGISALDELTCKLDDAVL